MSEKVISEIKDVFEIQRLKSLYCETVDILNDPAAVTTRLAAALAEDARAQFGHLGPFAGRQAIINYVLNDMGPALAWAWHAVHTPLIDIDGDTATGHWTLDLRVKLKMAPETVHSSPGRYVDKFQRTQDGWRISSLLWINES